MKNISFKFTPLNIFLLYFTSSFFFIVFAHIYTIWNAELILAPPLTGGLITWIHIHTMGAVTPVFIGIGFFNLQKRYDFIVKPYQIMIQFTLLYTSLIVFLFQIFSREGSPFLSISAALIFISIAYYIFLYAMVLRRRGKEKRNFEFWMDVISHYFLFQAVLFGFVLALNLSYPFLRTSELHSLKLHSHSGIAGFWFLQYINLIYRNNLSETHKIHNKYLKISGICMAVGLVLWTSVHDRLVWFIYFYYLMAGLSLFFLFLHFMQIFLKKHTLMPIYLINFCFMMLAFAFAGIMIFSGSEDLIFNKHIPFIYAYIIFYGVFVFVPILFLSGFSVSKKINNTGTMKISAAYYVYLMVAILFIFSVVYENILYMRIFESILLIIFLFIFTVIFRQVKNIQFAD